MTMYDIITSSSHITTIKQQFQLMTSLKGRAAQEKNMSTGAWPHGQALQAVERGERTDKIHVRRPSGWQIAVEKNTQPVLKLSIFLSIQFKHNLTKKNTCIILITILYNHV